MRRTEILLFGNRRIAMDRVRRVRRTARGYILDFDDRRIEIDRDRLREDARDRLDRRERDPR